MGDGYPVWKFAFNQGAEAVQKWHKLQPRLSVTMKAKMSKAANPPAIKPAAKLPVIHPHAAGIDIGSVEHYVCVPADAVKEGESAVRAFGGFTGELDKLVEWLQSCGVRTVAMESTGVYWIPLAQKLEAAGIETVLANARHLRQVPGRKTDVKDCQWLQQLHSYGLIQGSFRPTQDICRVRSLMRHRQNLAQHCGQQVQHMQKALQQMNVHLHHVISDLNGQTGLRILDAILAGERDPEKLLALRDERCCKSTSEEMAAALRGDWRVEHLFVLKQALETYRHLLKQMGDCEQEIQEALAEVLIPEAPPTAPSAPPNPPANPKARKKKGFHQVKAGTGLQRDLSKELERLCGVDLTQVTGLNVLGVLIILSEIGLDMSRWRNAKAFVSWLGLCPGNKISGGKVLSSRTPHVANRVAIFLRMVGPAVGRTDTFLGYFHRRMRARLGPAGANTATARKLACMIYHLLKYKEDFIDADTLSHHHRLLKRRLANLSRQAEELGFELTKKPAA
jgi:transposase